MKNTKKTWTAPTLQVARMDAAQAAATNNIADLTINNVPVLFS